MTYSQYNSQPQGCWFCEKRGHKKSQCRAFKAQNVSNNYDYEQTNINANNGNVWRAQSDEALSRSHNHSTFADLTVSPCSRRELIESVRDICLTGKINLVDRLYCPHMVEGHVYDSEGRKIPATFLCDTGSLQSICDRTLLPDWLVFKYWRVQSSERCNR